LARAWRGLLRSIWREAGAGGVAAGTTTAAGAAATFAAATTTGVFLYFLKIGALLFGSGYVLLAVCAKTWC